MSVILKTLGVVQFVLLILQVFSLKEGRLLGATQLTKEEILANHKGSASVALGHVVSVQWFQIGAVLSPTKFIAKLVARPQTSIIASNLVRPTTTDPPVADGEVYKVTGADTPYNGDSYISIVPFGPLKSDSKAIPATLAPAGTTPLPKGTEGCIAYTYGPITAGEVDPANFKLAYLPLTVLSASVCEFNATEQAIYFCATVISDGKSPFCNVWDFPMVAFCPSSVFGSLKKLEPAVNKWCRFPFSWWWWCNADVPPKEEQWVLVGVSAYNDGTLSCGVASNASAPEDILTFYYTKNI